MPRKKVKIDTDETPLPAEKYSDSVYGLDKALLDQLKKINSLPVIGYERVERIPTGSLNFDWMLGGGLPRGRMTIFVGDESTGKTTLFLMIAASIHRNKDKMKHGGRVAIIDTENTYDPQWALRMGLDPNLVHLFWPAHAEQACDTALALIRSGKFDAILFDSVAAAVPKDELEGTMESQFMGLQARIFSKFSRAMARPLAEAGTALVMVNQWRMKIGIAFGDPRTMPAGRALIYSASIIVNLLAPDTSDDEVIIFRADTGKKNKTAQKDRKCKVRLIVAGETRNYVDLAEELADMGIELGLFTDKDGVYALSTKGEKYIRGTWYYKGTDESNKIGGSRAAVIQAMLDNRPFLLEVEAEVRAGIEALNGIGQEDSQNILEVGEEEDAWPETIIMGEENDDALYAQGEGFAPSQDFEDLL